MEFKKFDWVIWSSQAAGRWKTKIGFITHIHTDRAGKVIGYDVQVPPREGSKAKPKMYYPRISALKPYQKLD
ncbi:hypothetical protein [Pantoea stewartii]|uniref:Uncharacterized protein n=1 Tax=Pantoea stewartii subsp. stewartii DC283 TaxID=660596 RepID=H3R861_PANSE|nr:hypothetical protein [Pantoea stewartii]ARF48847.1 hypothetical protein DSJ_05535 [Pantoea stewartii subsp. stewartii DC283]EHU02197.1 hypothetical protein CKS_5016 [Pantoea stewartii subsp. stewartii DC283]KAB0545532.1 hypothetical protein F7Q90_24440 [Pantoea stewartii subsp. stewartii]